MELHVLALQLIQIVNLGNILMDKDVFIVKIPVQKIQDGMEKIVFQIIIVHQVFIFKIIFVNLFHKLVNIPLLIMDLDVCRKVHVHMVHIIQIILVNHKIHVIMDKHGVIHIFNVYALKVLDGMEINV